MTALAKRPTIPRAPAPTPPASAVRNATARNGGNGRGGMTEQQASDGLAKHVEGCRG
jgi:hypothetical protein